MICHTVGWGREYNELITRDTDTADAHLSTLHSYHSSAKSL